MGLSRETMEEETMEEETMGMIRETMEEETMWMSRETMEEESMTRETLEGETVDETMVRETTGQESMDEILELKTMDELMEQVHLCLYQCYISNLKSVRKLPVLRSLISPRMLLRDRRPFQ